ncbi:Glycosyl transferase family 8 [Candidatus Hepatincola sp. Av]
MKGLKILVGYHKKGTTFYNKSTLPILLGSATQPDDIREFFQRYLYDDQGNNISNKNSYYSELTALYWAWKNLDYLNAKYIGFMHYRRFLKINEDDYFNISTLTYNLDSYTKQVEKIMGTQADLIIPKKEYVQYDWLLSAKRSFGVTVNTKILKKLSTSTYITLEEHYIYLHIPDDFYIALKIMQEKYPKIYKVAKKSIKNNSGYFCNIFVANKSIFKDMMSYLFTIMFELEKRRDGWVHKVYKHNYQKRVAGFIAERLVSIYIDYLYSQKTYRIIEKPMVVIDNNENSIINKNTMNIFSAANKHYGQPLAVMIASILYNAKPQENFSFYIFDFGIKESDKEKLLKLRKIKNFNIEYINIPHNIWVKLEHLKNVFTTCSYIDISTYARLFIAELFPKMQQCLYLDADLVVNESLQELYKYDIGNCILGGVRDALGYKSKEYKDRLNMSQDSLYVNAGVLKINIQQLKQIDIYKTILAYAKKEEMNIIFGDQDILNVIFENKICELPLKYNMNAHFFAPLREDVKLHTVEEREFYYNTANYKTMGILHYFGPNKPWKSSNDWGPNKNVWLWYWHYCKMTPHKNTLSQFCGREVKYKIRTFMESNKNNIFLKLSKRILVLIVDFLKLLCLPFKLFYNIYLYIKLYINMALK